MPRDFREAMRNAREQRDAEASEAHDPATRAARAREAEELERWRKLYAVVYDIRSILLFWLVLGLIAAAIIAGRALQ